MNTIPDRVESATVPEPEVSVFEAFTPLLRNWRTLLRIPFALGAVTAVITLLIPSTYTAVTSFTTESASPTAGGGLASLAGQLGGGLLGSAGAILGAPTSADLFAEVLTSRELLETTLDSKFRDYDSAHPDSLRSLLDLLGITGDTPLKRAVNCTRSLSMVSRRVAPELILRTISPFLTYAAGTRVSPLTLTARYGVSPLSAHHSQMARMR